MFFRDHILKNRYFTSCEACVFMYTVIPRTHPPITFSSGRKDFPVLWSTSIIAFGWDDGARYRLPPLHGWRQRQLLGFFVFSLGKIRVKHDFSDVLCVSYHTPPPKKKWLVFIPHFFSHVAPAKWWLDWESKFSRGYLKLQECRLWLYRGLGKQRIIIGHMKDKYHWPSDMWSGTQLEVSDTWS